jgi:hypothetical protein
MSCTDLLAEGPYKRSPAARGWNCLFAENQSWVRPLLFPVAKGRVVRVTKLIPASFRRISNLYGQLVGAPVLLLTFLRSIP